VPGGLPRPGDVVVGFDDVGGQASRRGSAKGTRTLFKPGGVHRGVAHAAMDPRSGRTVASGASFSAHVAS
jgi:hypothetical protein